MKRLTEKDFVDRLFYVFKAPIIVWPQFEDTITKEMQANVTLHRLSMFATAKTINAASEYETMLYLSSASLANPPSHEWTKIYIHLFGKFYPKQAEILGNTEKPNDYELNEYLVRLRVWIFKQQMQALKAKEKAENPQKQQAVVSSKYADLTKYVVTQ